MEDTVVTALESLLIAASNLKLLIYSTSSILIRIMIINKDAILESIGRYLHLVACTPSQKTGV